MLSEKLRQLCSERELPYLDVRVFRGYEPVCSFLYRADGKELLQMYSMSKAVTVVAAMMLVEQGKLSLTDPVDKFFPVFANTTYCRNGEVLPNPNRMTVWNLFTMTSGMSYHVHTPQILAVTAEKGNGALLRDYVQAFAETPLSFPCGEEFQYSLSHDLLAAIVEKVAGVSFDAFVKQMIFDPLEMPSSTFQNRTEGLCDMYACGEDLTVRPTHNRNSLLFSKAYISGGAGMVTRVEDYAKLVKALANGGVAENGWRLLREETVRAIAEPVLSPDFVKKELNWLSGDYGYGLGVRVRTRDTDWGLKKGEFGWDGAAGSYWMADPNEKISVVIGMNVLDWDRRYQGIHLEITEMIYRALFS